MRYNLITTISLVIIAPMCAYIVHLKSQIEEIRDKLNIVQVDYKNQLAHSEKLTKIIEKANISIEQQNVALNSAVEQGNNAI